MFGLFDNILQVNVNWKRPAAVLFTAVFMGIFSSSLVVKIVASSDGTNANASFPVLNQEPGHSEVQAGVPEGIGGIQSTVGNLELVWLSTEVGNTESVAWGDYDRDNDLDLAVGSYGEPTRVYENIGEGLLLVWVSSEWEFTSSIAWGDYDNDADLDLAVGSYHVDPYFISSISVYSNVEGTFTLSQKNFCNWDDTTSVAWGDWDGDGDLDLAAGNHGQPIRVYDNVGAYLTLAWSSPVIMSTKSIAWGDWDNDADLDLAVGNDGQPNQVYENLGGVLVLDPPNGLGWSSQDIDYTESVAWGDWDGDGDLDLATGNNGQSNKVYENDTGTLILDPSNNYGWSSLEMDRTMDLAWGDWDSDGDIDLVVGNSNFTPGQPNRVYTNVGGNLILGWSSSETKDTHSLAWGDWDGDGDFDLVEGNKFSPIRVFRNTGSHLNESDFYIPGIINVHAAAWGDWDGDRDLDLAIGSNMGVQLYENVSGNFTLAWTIGSGLINGVNSVAWGDWDNDSDLDLAVSGYEDSIRIYENTGGDFILAWLYPADHALISIAWGDSDGDGDLDLAAGVYGQRNRVFINTGGNLIVAWESAELDYTTNIAWGDWDGDSDLDLAVGNSNQPNRVYENIGGNFVLIWSSPESYDTRGIAWGDWDGDGDLDLIVGNSLQDIGEPLRLYTNIGGDLLLTWTSVESNVTWNVGWGDIDNDFDLDLATGNEVSKDAIYINSNNRLSLFYPSLNGDLSHGLAWGDSDNDGDLDLLSGNYLYENNNQRRYQLADNPNWAQIWYPGGSATSFYGTSNILDGPTIPITYTLIDKEGHPANNINGYFSLDAGSTWHPAVATTDTITTNLISSPTGTIHLFTWDIYQSNIVGISDSTIFRLDIYPSYYSHGPYQYAVRTARTLPFRLRGSQIYVSDGGLFAQGAIVFRQKAGQNYYEPYHDQIGRPYRTNPAGYLQGYGEIAVGDRLVAMLPIASTDTYTLYYTSASPTLTSVDAFEVTAGGVQTLTVSADNPLILYNLDISLEWDARKDAQFLSQLEYDLRRTSEFLYDWTDGQAALGKITIYHDRQRWQDAHIRIYASNRLRPNAPMGGLVGQDLVDPDVPETVYTPGQVYMGPTWSRYGEPGGSLGEDWPRALAHELGHFALFLDDNYLGLDDQGRLIPVDTCPGAMSDPYRDDYSELHGQVNWDAECGDTLAALSTGRWDWATISTFYPWLDGADNPGPSTLPLKVTQVDFVDPPAQATTLDVPIFNLMYNGARLQPGADARAYIFRPEGDWLVDLGRPTLDQVIARGARPGDKVCVYELVAGRLGCETVSTTDSQIDLVDVTGWQPDVQVTPVTSRTIEIDVIGVPAGLALKARLYSTQDPGYSQINLSGSDGVYQGTFNLAKPVPEGYVHVWVEEPAPRREIVTYYALGGNPGRSWPRYGRSWPRYVDAISNDGQVAIYGDDLVFPEGEFYGVQAVTNLPTLPPWATLVGNAFRVFASPGAPDLSNTSIAFYYLGDEVPPGEESWLKVYYWDGAAWQALETSLNAYHNVASASSQGQGLYALMSTLEIPLYGPGWNLIAYPINEPRPVALAMQSVDGYYTTVYGYSYQDAEDHWKVYDVGVPVYVNDLEELVFGAGYWVYATQDVPLRMKGSETLAMDMPAGMDSFGNPPTTYYGPVVGNVSFTPEPDMTVTAWIDGNPCGQGKTLEYEGQIVYTINVFATDPSGTSGCGVKGKKVHFRVDEQSISTTAIWGNERLWEVPLDSNFKVHLPVVPEKFVVISPLTQLHLDELAGSILFKDSSGNLNDGLCTGDTCPQAGLPGKLNYSIFFDGADDTIALSNPDIYDLSLDDSLTILAWINLESTDCGYCRILTKSDLASGFNFDAADNAGNTQLTFWVNDGNHRRTTRASTAISTNEWHHVAVVFDRDLGLVRLYLDGAEVDYSIQQDLAGVGAVISAADVLVGNQAEDTNAFHGYLDELTVYKSALSQDEIFDQYIRQLKLADVGV